MPEKDTSTPGLGDVVINIAVINQRRRHINIHSPAVTLGPIGDKFAIAELGVGIPEIGSSSSVTGDIS